jgi:hypothetical protein
MSEDEINTDAEVEIEGPEIELRQALEDAYDDAELSDPEQEQISDQRGDIRTESAKPTIAVPKSWSKEASEWLSAEPKDVNEAKELRRKIAEYAATRQDEADRDYTSKTQALAREREAFQRQASQLNGVYKTLEPKLEEFHLRGIDPTAWLNEVLALDQLARKDKRAALAHIAQKWQVDPQELIQSQQPQQQLPPQLQQTLQVYGQKLSQLEQRHLQQQQASENARLNYHQREVETFLNSTNEQGEPLYPHYDRVAQDMETEVRLLVAQNPGQPPREILKAAYDRAIWKNNETRAELLAQQQKQQEVQERAQAAKRVSEAKRAASPLSSSPNGKMATSNKSLRELLDEAWDEHALT